MTDMDLITSLLSRVFTSAPPVFLFVVLIALGYALKTMPWVRNDWIPMVNLIVAMVAYPLISKADLGNVPQMRLPMVGALIRDVLGGIIIFAGAWVTHRVVLKRLLDRFIPQATNKDGDTKFFQKPDVISPPPPKIESTQPTKGP
jgi:hypothetical protein